MYIDLRETEFSLIYRFWRKRIEFLPSSNGASASNKSNTDAITAISRQIRPKQHIEAIESNRIHVTLC